MEQRFTQLAFLGENLLAKRCPLLVRTMAIFRDMASGQVLLQIQFENIVQNPVAAVKVEVACKSVFSDELGKLSVQYLDLEAPRGGRFGLEQLIPVSDETREAEILEMRIVFVDGQKWESEEIAFVPLEQQARLEDVWPVGACQMLEQEGRIQSPAFLAEYVPNEQKEYWLCACGGFNWPEEERCGRCGISREWLREAVDPQRLRQEWERTEAQKNAAAQKKKKKKKIIAWSVCSALAVVLVAMTGFGVFFWTHYGTVENKYRYALALMDKGNYKKAAGLLEELDGYEDSNLHFMDAKLKAANVRQLYVDHNWVGKVTLEGKIEVLAGTPQLLLPERQDIVQIERNGDGILYCLTKEGVILKCTQEQTEELKGTYTQIAVAKGCLFGLKEPGTVELVEGRFDERYCTGNYWGNWTSVVSISGGEGHLAALQDAGGATAYGSNILGEIEIGEWRRVRRIVAGNEMTLGIDEKGNPILSGRGKINENFELATNVDYIVDVQQYGVSLVALDLKGKMHVFYGKTEDEKIYKELREIGKIEGVMSIAAFQEGVGLKHRAFAAVDEAGELLYYRYV